MVRKSKQRGVQLLCILMMVFFLPTCSLAVFKKDATSEDLLAMNSAYTGDFEPEKMRRMIRVLVPYNRAFFFFEGATPRGLSYEIASEFEKFVNKKLGSKTIKIKIIYIPTPREQILDRLKHGKGDIAIGNLTITDERKKLVDFSDPFVQNVSEILTTNKEYPTVSRSYDLSGKEVYVRKSSSYYENLLGLNEVLAFTDKEPVKIVEADEHLEDSDLLEMVNVGVIPAIIIDNHKGKLWAQIYDNIKLHPKAKVHSGGQIAWAIRKGSPKLKALINEFVKGHKKGTLFGNIVINRYLKSAAYITNAAHTKEVKKFKKSVEFFKKYGEKYHFDHLMLAALAYQESRLDQSLRSPVGAVGVMQILPSTAKDKNVGIPDIEQLEPNIHAGTKYLHFMSDRYFPEGGEVDELNRVFFTFASYNAGPGRVAGLRREAKQMGLNPNLWFNHVEVVAAKRIGRETVDYVSNIMKYYVAYKLIADRHPE